jgi:serine phosphatase RsbU (regulator of sigma subunit)
MGRLRTALAALAPLTRSPKHMLGGLDEFVQGPNGVEYATACCGVLDPATGDLCYASAGHPPMLVVHPDGRNEWLTGGHSIALCRVDAAYRSRTQSCVRLEPGSLVVAYSDGLVERRRISLVTGLQRLQEIVVRYRNEACEDVCEAILDQMTGGITQEDDIVIVCLRYTPE